MIEERLKFEIGLETSNNFDRPDWTPDYKEGFIDGLNRAIEILGEVDDED